MTQKAKLSLVVHAQDNTGERIFNYTNHQNIRNIKKYVDLENSANLVAEDYGKPLFKTKYYWKSNNRGYFDPENINEYLKDKNIDPEERLDFEIDLLGGGFICCLGNAFRLISVWESGTHHLNRTCVKLPLDGVFSKGEDDKIITLKEKIKNPYSSYELNLFFTKIRFKGQMNIKEEYIHFKFRERPWGLFVNNKLKIQRDYPWGLEI